MKQPLWIGIFVGVLVWSGINPADRFTWWLEVAPALLAAAALLITAKRFPLTPLAYTLILIHCLILFLGAHYTYEEVPIGHWASEQFGWTRNNFDKLGHIAQGFIPAIIVREVLVRNLIVLRRGWLFFITIAMCLGFAAAYELVEWWAAVAVGENAEAFLGTQGYEWDAQSDMFMCLIGATASLVTLGWLHDRQMTALAYRLTRSITRA